MEVAKDLLSAIAPTSRFTGAGRLKSMREDIACCLIKLLRGSIEAMTDDQSQMYAPQHTRVGGQTSNRNADMVIYSVHLLLV